MNYQNTEVMVNIALTLLVGGGFLLLIGNVILNASHSESPKFMAPTGALLLIIGVIAVFICPIILIWYT